MRNYSEWLISFTLLATQVVIPVPISATAPVPADAIAGGTKTQTPKIKFNILSPNMVEAEIPHPSFDSEILAPLRAKQAEAKAALAAQLAAQKAAAKKKAKKVAVATKVVKTTVKTVSTATGDVWGALRMCEAGGVYTRNSGNGYYGAYQYNLGTWANYMGYARPDLAPAEVQDAKARETQAARGWSPWPACARKLALL